MWPQNIVVRKLPRNILACLCPSCWNNATPPPSVFQRWHFLLGDRTSQKRKGCKSWKCYMTRQSQEKKGRIGLCLRNKKAFDGELISGAMCSRFSSIRGTFLEFCWGGCCHWQGRAGSIYWDCQTSQKQKWSPSGDVTTFESFGFCTKASFTIYVGRRWSLRIKIGIKEGIIRLPTISFYQIA